MPHERPSAPGDAEPLSDFGRFERGGEAHPRLELLARAHRVLGTTNDPDALLAAVARLAVESLADACIIDIVEGEGQSRLAALAHLDPAEEAIGREVRRSFPPRHPHPIFEVFRTGQPWLGTEDNDTRRARAQSDEHLARLEAIDLRTQLIVPLQARARVIGTLTLARKSGRSVFVENELTLAGELAQWTALAVDNAILLQRAEQAKTWVMRLQAVTAGLAAAGTVLKIAEVVLHQGAGALGTHRGSFRVLEQGGTILRTVLRLGYPEATGSPAALPAAFPAPVSEAAHLGSPIFLETRAAIAARYPALIRVRGIDDGAIAAVPLAHDGRVLGAFGITFNDERRFSTEDRGLLEAMAHQAAQAMERARLYEAEAEARTAADAANRAKGAFIANMSHEIRTPLTALLGFSDLLVSPHLGESDRLNYVMIIRRNSEHLVSLLNDILDLSKMEAGQLDIAHVECQLLEILSGVASLMRVRAADAGTEFTVHLITPIPTVIRTDPTRLRQILLNLVGNAVKFTRTGSVLVQARYEARTTPPRLVIDVIDTGVGMNAEQLGRLFKRFEQADPSMSRRFGGTGLGLAICKPLAEALGGAISVRSALGEGSTFTLTLRPDVPAGTPLSRSMTDSAGATAPLQAQPRLTGSVLLAEDGPDNQVLISAILGKCGLSVVVADDGEAAVARALAAVEAGAPFDLVLMDMQMPVLDGYAATHQMRRRGLRVPIIALTAHAMAGERERCLAAGCDGYLSKPVDRTVLVETIGGYLKMPAGQPEAESALAAPPSAPRALESSFAGDQDMEQIIRRFVGGLPARISAIRAAAAQDRPEARRLSHQLKGAGGYFAPITEAAARLERAFEEGRSDGEIGPLVDALAELSRRAHAGLRT